MSASTTAVSKSTRGKSVQTRDKLIDAGIFLFTRQGYEAVSTRQIETHAAVQRNLVTYHFSNKEEFWKACVAKVFRQIATTMQPAITQSKDIEPAERIRFLIRQFVRASAANPAVARIMFDEGRCNDWRLEWLVENYGRGFYQTVARLFNDGQQHDVLPDISLPQFYYALVSSAAIFAMAPECHLLSGQDPNTETMINAQADTIAMLLTRAH
ncbi:MAG: TetR/AcrR family transcriptional regulator [Pseudomonadota bacterium]